MCMGMTVANLLGVPLGSLIGNIMTWRYVFIFNIGWGLITLLAIRRFIPVLPALPKSNIKGQFRFLKSPAPWLLSGATLLGNGGVFCMYSYVTPLMTEDAGVGMSFIPVLMLLVGAGMCIGTYYGGVLSDRYTPVRVARIIEITLIVTLAGLYLFSCNVFAAVSLVCLAATALFAISPPMQLIQSRQCHRRPMRRTSYRSRSGPAILVAHRSRFRSTRHRVSVPVLPAQISLEPVTHALYDCHKCAMPPTPQCITDFQRLRYYLMSPPALSACPIHAKARITTNSISIVISINITRKATMTFTSKINRHPGQLTAHQS